MRSPFVLSLVLLVIGALTGANLASASDSILYIRVRLIQAQKGLSSAQALLARAKTYPPSSTTSHKQAVFAQRVQSWQAVLDDCEQKLEALQSGTAAPVQIAGSSNQTPVAASPEASTLTPSPDAAPTSISVTVVVQATPTVASQLWVTSVRKSSATTVSRATAVSASEACVAIPALVDNTLPQLVRRLT